MLISDMISPNVCVSDRVIPKIAQKERLDQKHSE